MSLRQINSRWLFVLLVAFCFLGFIFALNQQAPFVSDDYDLCLSHVNHAENGRRLRLKGVQDIVATARQFYLGANNGNGRVLANTGLMFFTGHPKVYFNLVNTGMTGLLLLLIWSFAFSKEALRWDRLAFLLFGFLFFCFSGMACLWGIGTVNYLWSAVFALSFIKIWNYFVNNPCSARLWPFVFLFGFVFGWTQETFVLPVLATFVSMSIVRRQKFSFPVLILMAGCLVGACFLCFGPGSLRRGQGGTVLGVCLQSLLHGEKLPWAGVFKTEILTGIGLLKTALLAVFSLLLGLNKKFRDDNYQIGLLVFWSLALIVGTGLTHEGQPFGATVFALILVLRWTESLRMSSLLRKTLAGCFSVCVAVSFVFVYQSAKKIYGEYRRSVDYFVASSDCVSFQNDSPSTFNRFIFCPPISINRDGFQNRVFAEYFSKPYACFLPKPLFYSLYLKDELCLPNNLVANTEKFYSLEGLDYVVCKLAEGEHAPEKVNIRYDVQHRNYDWVSRLKAFARGERAYSDLFTGTEVSPILLCTRHGKYLIVPMTNFCKNYVKSIRFLAE
jgi:hypothetical protein